MEKEKKSDHQKTCTSVFKNGTSTTTKEIYTQKWTELINALIKTNRASPDKKQ